MVRSIRNVNSETAFLLGTIRTLSAERRLAVRQGLRTLTENIAAAHGARAAVEIEAGFSPTVCDASAVEQLFGQRPGSRWRPR